MDSFYQDLDNWFQTPLGHFVAQQQRQQIQSMLPQLTHARCLQIGQLGDEILLPPTKLCQSYQVYLNQPNQPNNQHSIPVIAEAEALPFAAEQINLCLMPHVLEFSTVPQQVLREIDRVLVEDGYLLLTGFNPLSLWGIRRLFNNQMPFCGQFLSFFRVKDWLNLLGFEVIQSRHTVFNLPLQNKKIRQTFLFLDSLGNRWQWQSGGVYILLARKRRYPLTPIKNTINYQPLWVQS